MGGKRVSHKPLNPLCWVSQVRLNPTYKSDGVIAIRNDSRPVQRLDYDDAGAPHCGQ